MTAKEIEEKVTVMALPSVEARGFELVDVEYVKEGANRYLRIYIDKPGGIVIEDCQAVSEEIDNELEKQDLIKQSYFLEVSSPGERPLKKDTDFDKYRGELVEIKLYEAIAGEKVVEGILLGLFDGKIAIRRKDGSAADFDRVKVALVRRVIGL